MRVLREVPEYANWMARDANGEVWVFEDKPYKDEYYWYSQSDGEFDQVELLYDEYVHVKWEDTEPTRIWVRGTPTARSATEGMEHTGITKYITELTGELYAAQEKRLQRFLATHPELDITDLYFKGTVDNIEVRGSGEGGYVVTQVLPRIHIKPRKTSVTGYISDQAVQDQLALYSNNKVKITIEVE